MPGLLGAALCLTSLLLPLPLLSRVFFAASTLNFLIFAGYYGNIYNLPGLFGSIFLLQIACSQARLTAVEQEPFSRDTWLVLLAVLAGFYAVTLLLNRLLRLRRSGGGEAPQLRIVPGTLLLLNIACLLVEGAVYLLVYRRLGTLPLFDDTVRAVELPALVGNIGMTFMTLPQFLVMLNMADGIRRDRYTMSLFSVAYLLLLISLGARINVFLPVGVCLVLLLAAMTRQRQRFWKLLGIAVLTCALTVALMLGIPLLRTAAYVPSDTPPTGGDTVATGESYYESLYADASMNRGQTDPDPDYGVHLPSALLPVWVNFSTELHGFNNMVNTLSRTGDFQHGRCFLTGTLNFVCKHWLDKPNSMELSGIGFINVCTFLMEPYHDFGLWGAVAFVMLFTAAGLLLYRRMQRGGGLFVRLYYAYFCVIAVMFIFVNQVYYSTFLVNTALLALCSWVVGVDWRAKLRGLLRRH